MAIVYIILFYLYFSGYPELHVAHSFHGGDLVDCRLTQVSVLFPYFTPLSQLDSVGGVGEGLLWVARDPAPDEPYWLPIPLPGSWVSTLRPTEKGAERLELEE